MRLGAVVSRLCRPVDDVQPCTSTSRATPHRRRAREGRLPMSGDAAWALTPRKLASGRPGSGTLVSYKGMWRMSEGILQQIFTLGRLCDDGGGQLDMARLPQYRVSTACNMHIHIHTISYITIPWFYCMSAICRVGAHGSAGRCRDARARSVSHSTSVFAVRAGTRDLSRRVLRSRLFCRKTLGTFGP